MVEWELRDNSLGKIIYVTPLPTLFLSLFVSLSVYLFLIERTERTSALVI